MTNAIDSMILMADVLPTNSEKQPTPAFLLMLADLLDGWAEQSMSGGWSTHQVEANRQTADMCRTKALLILTES